MECLKKLSVCSVCGCRACAALQFYCVLHKASALTGTGEAAPRRVGCSCTVLGIGKKRSCDSQQLQGKLWQGVQQHLAASGDASDKTPLIPSIPHGQREVLVGSGWTAHQAAQLLTEAVIVQQFGPSDPALWQKEEEPDATLGHPRFEVEKQLTTAITLQPKHRAATWKLNLSIPLVWKVSRLRMIPLSVYRLDYAFTTKEILKGSSQLLSPEQHSALQCAPYNTFQQWL